MVLIIEPRLHSICTRKSRLTKIIRKNGILKIRNISISGNTKYLEIKIHIWIEKSIKNSISIFIVQISKSTLFYYYRIRKSVYTIQFCIFIDRKVYEMKCLELLLTLHNKNNNHFWKKDDLNNNRQLCTLWKLYLYSKL